MSGGGIAFAISTSDGGAVWNKDGIPAGVYTLNSVTCLTAFGCWAEGLTPVESLILKSG
jgi:hypothetical protein